MKIQFVYRVFIKNFQSFLKISQQFAFFAQNAKTFNAWFFNFVEKYAKIIYLCNFLQNFFGNFRKFSKSFTTMFFFQTREKLTHGLLNF